MDKFTPLLAKEFSRREEHIENILRLLDEGNTVPFIARYRKEMHGTTDDQTIRAIADRLAYLRGLDERKAAVVSAIQAHGRTLCRHRKCADARRGRGYLPPLHAEAPHARHDRARKGACAARGAAALADGHVRHAGSARRAVCERRKRSYVN